MKPFITLLAIIFSFTSIASAQQTVIKKGYAYYLSSPKGMVKAGDESHPERNMNVEHILYLETPGKFKPQITKIQSGKRIFSADIEQVLSGTELAGTRAADGKAQTVTAARGNKLWRIYLSENVEYPSTTPLKNIIISYYLNGKISRFVVKGETRLNAVPMADPS
ncbi:MAG: hypothetical protein JWQ27_491 [Ferruginibacter sp.]|nr:hypothetical protein [Ferruginibacter sp.]